MEQNSSDKMSVDDFISWALKLGCPVSALPSDLILNRFIKSSHENLKKILLCIQPKNEVKLIRDNLLLKSLESSKLLSTNLQWQSDSDLKNINKVEKINEKISQLKSRVKQLKTEVEAKQLTLMIKADKSAKAIRNRHIGETKCIQLRQKHAQWLEKVSEEQKFVEKLESSTPAEDTSIKKNNCESTIKRLIQFLDSFYADVGDCPIFVTQRHNVEKNIQNIIADVPVFTLFEAIQCYSEKGIKIVDQTFNSNDDHSSNDSVSSAIDVAISKSRIKIYVSHLKTKNLKSEHATCVENYFYLYDQYLNKIIAEMKAFNALDTELFAESICNDYLKVHGTWMCNQVLSEIHQQKLANLQRRATERDDLLKGEELVASELSAMYEAIEKTYNLILNDLMALGNVNQNMKQMQAVSRYTINNFGSKNTWNTSLNTSAVVPSITINSVPTEYFNELSKLSDVVCKDWRKLRQMISMDIALPRHKESFSPVASLLTPNAALKELKTTWSWYKAIDDITKPLDIDKPFPKFTRGDILSSTIKMESVHMAKLVDDIKFMHQAGCKAIGQIQKYLEFLLNTSLGSFIPANVMINRVSFKDYEDEFLCACSMRSKCTVK